MTVFRSRLLRLRWRWRCRGLRRVPQERTGLLPVQLPDGWNVLGKAGPEAVAAEEMALRVAIKVLR